MIDIFSFYHILNITSKHIFLIITLFLVQIKLFTSAVTSCIAQDNFNTKTCFNDIIKFSDKKYRAGQILTNKNNVTTIIFSDDSPGNSRLLYSLGENGRGFFYDNETVIKVLTLTSNAYHDDINIIGRYECLNDFVYLEDDVNREKQYILSISSYLSLTELYDVEEGAHQQWVTPAFFNISEWKRYIFSYRFSLFEWKNTSVYFCVFVQYEGTDHNKQDYSISYTISRFRLNKDTTNEQISVKTVETSYEDKINYDNRIVSSIFLEKYDVLVVFFVKNQNVKYTLKFYDYDLNSINDYEYEAMSNPLPGYGAFLKAVHCQYEYVGLMYYTDGNSGYSLILKFIKINERDNKNLFTNLEQRLKVEIKDQDFKTYILLNEFYKINPDRFIFASTTTFQKLYIYLIQQTNWYKYVKIKKYDYWLPSATNNIKFAKEFAFGIYKGFLVFTGTISSNYNDASDFSSYLIFFGYANGTDFTADITKYMADIEGYDVTNDFATFL